MLPQTLVPGLREQLGRAHVLWAKDQAEGRGGAQDLLGRADVATTMISTHVLLLGGSAVRSPMNAMGLD
jgi:hypothetical protein